ncbi:apolipoprotein N-acyltransferase [Duganella sp. LX20W]|uniref:Apolipoprotein N-acyltransferase n=1 Tax=Rugamonas brunnea TaxID=2758569 RepID=A0A7W2IB03_9BURK|nr:apolipoprotein N-acyltransferase [Rugamonas brunnea]
MPAAILASALMSALYARGGAGWLLGFVLLVPCLRALDASPTVTRALLRGWAMAIGYTAGAFAWFGIAFGHYTQIGGAAGLAILLLAAPLFQPQFLSFAVVRHLTRQRYGAAPGALAGAAAWVATEWLLPKFLGDTLGYGLYPSVALRQGAAVVGTAGLTLLLLLANEGVAAALAPAWRAAGPRAIARPLAMAALAPLLLAGYGQFTLSASPAPQGKPLRMGMIQSNIIDYERQRQEKGTAAFVREVLDTHYAMSYDAVERQHVDAVVWSETVYPTTFGHPKSAAGAELDREIVGIVNAAGVPFVFGTYDRDRAGEYNAAAFVQPGAGLLGFYRKTRLFPLTEYVPAWLDGPQLRRLLPWTGNWQPGNGARVLPLRLADGREIPVQPLICFDDMDTNLAIDGVRLGAQAILTMSNDSWFTADPLGARLHQSAAAFRSIETRLPQFRVTSNGYSGVIDATGAILAGTRMGEQTLVVGALPVQTPAPTLIVRWGDWVGRVAAAALVLLAVVAAFPAWRSAHTGEEATAAPAISLAAALPARVAVLSPATRLLAGLLRAGARGGLLWMCLVLLLNEALRTNTLAQIRLFSMLFLLPEAAAWCVLTACSAQAMVVNGKLALTRGGRRRELALSEVAEVQLWRLPFPGPGLSLRLNTGRRWRYGLALTNADARAAARAATAAQLAQSAKSAQAAEPSVRGVPQVYAQTSLAIGRSRLDHPLLKHILLPFALALPAFHLYQHIAYGSAFGEYYSFGLKAYLSAFALWWAAWAIGVVLTQTLLRMAISMATLLVALLRPARAIAMRRWLERAGHVALYLGMPGWLLLTIYRA